MSEQSILSDPSSTFPVDPKTLRACRVCCLVKSQDQFSEFGCQNCYDVWSAASALELTTPQFYGLVTMLDPAHSWVSKRQRMKGRRKQNQIMFQVFMH
ncbi:uncharacterized protein LOC126315381 isoform X2 [Schistocerca gregaria]|uniref:uncharacterized protein LOC126315381 isoform X2 n=1 Tax=Schistocerca gregaria TaxID=7010 RepID=UPI00211EA451|nr:uncharacterized protein LOC126315381 isoform X2 [Schistocerca gregaria]